MLSRWRKKAREGRIVGMGVQIDKVVAELKVLRKVKREYERLKIEHEHAVSRQTFGSPRVLTRRSEGSPAILVHWAATVGAP